MKEANNDDGNNSVTVNKPRIWDLIENFTRASVIVITFMYRNLAIHKRYCSSCVIVFAFFCVNFKFHKTNLFISARETEGRCPVVSCVRCHLCVTMLFLGILFIICTFTALIT